MKKYAVNFIILLIIITTVNSCNFYGDVDLGNGYYLWRDGKCEEVVYRLNNKNREYPIMCPIKMNVNSYYVNDTSIYIETLYYENKNNIIRKVNKFYIIKKKTLNIDKCDNQKQIDSLFKTIIVPIKDSISFYKILSDKGFELN